MSDNYGDFLIVCIALVGIAFGIGEWIGRTSVKPTVKRVETCSPRSIDSYSGKELVGIGYGRMLDVQ